MDQHIMNTDGLSYIDSRIGVELVDGSFIIADDCIETLEEIATILLEEDPILKPVRHRMAFVDLVKFGIVPILRNIKENEEDIDADKLFYLTMKVLSLLSQPFLGKSSSNQGVDINVERKISCLLESIKEIFANPDLTWTILERMSLIIEKMNSNPEMFLTEYEIQVVNCVIYFYRNILYIQANKLCDQEFSINDRIIYSLLECGFKEVMKTLLASHQHDQWCLSLVQLFSLFYKQEFGPNAISSQGTLDQNTHAPSRAACKSEIPDSLSPSSNVCLNTPSAKTCPVYGMAKKMNMMLKELAVDFISSGWGTMLCSIRSTILYGGMQSHVIDYHYFMWLVQFFLSIARSEKLPFQCIRQCLSMDVISLVLSLNVMSCKHVNEITSSHLDGDVSHELQGDCGWRNVLVEEIRKNYMTVVAIREICSTINQLRSSDLDTEDAHHLWSLQNSLIQISNMKYIFVLLLRQYNPLIHNKQYLIEVIKANHEYLLLADEVLSQNESNCNFDMQEHISLFATPDLILKYNSILDDFKSNPTSVNNCIFTMLHHIAGDCQRHDALLKMPVVQNFLNILEMSSSNKVPDECVKLMEYVLHQCIGKLEANSLDCVRLLCGIDFELNDDFKNCETPAKFNEFAAGLPLSNWSEEEETEFLIQLSKTNDTLSETDKVKEIAIQMEKLGITKTVSEVENYMYQYMTNKKEDIGETGGVCIKSSVEVHTKLLYQEGNHKWLDWIKDCLLELKIVKSRSWQKPVDPVALHYSALGQPVPIVLYTEWQAISMKDKTFRHVLQLMGINLPEPEKEHLFPTIPQSWTIDDLKHMATLIYPEARNDPRITEIHQSECMMELTMDLPEISKTMGLKKEVKLSNNLWPMLVQKANIS